MSLGSRPGAGTQGDGREPVAGGGVAGPCQAAPVRRAVVVVASTSAAAGEAADRTGPVIVDWLRDRGFACDGPLVVPDGDPVGAAVRAVLLDGSHDASGAGVPRIDSRAGSPGAPGAGADVVIVTGGTGVSPSDQTPEQVAPLIDVELPGIIEEVRRLGVAATPMAVLTRGVAGFAGGTFVVTLPGSPGGVADGLAVLDGVLLHVLAQRAGGASHSSRR